MQSNKLKPKTTRTKSPRIGRGGKRGKTAGRGTKGQNARAGHRKRPEMRDLIKKMPKLRGHGKNRARTVRIRAAFAPVNLSTLEGVFKTGDTITPAVLAKAGVVTTRAGKMPRVKILGTGELTKALSISGCAFSVSAKEAIEKAGGSIL